MISQCIFHQYRKNMISIVQNMINSGLICDSICKKKLKSKMAFWKPSIYVAQKIQKWQFRYLLYRGFQKASCILLFFFQMTSQIRALGHSDHFFQSWSYKSKSMVNPQSVHFNNFIWKASLFWFFFFYMYCWVLGMVFWHNLQVPG